MTAANPTSETLVAGSGRSPEVVRPDWTRTRTTGLLLIAVILVLWEVSSRMGWVVSDNWPPVTRVVYALAQGILGGELATAWTSTLYRVAIGYVIGSAAAVLLGLLLGRVTVWDKLLRPPIEMVRTLPGPALLPPLILLLGVGDALKIVVIALGAFFPVFVNAYSGVKSIDSTLLLTARTFRLSRGVTLRRIIVPAALPSIAAGMRISISLALTVGVIAEMISGASGLGFYLMSMQFALRADAMYATVILLAGTGYVLNRLFVHGEERLIFWRAT